MRTILVFLTALFLFGCEYIEPTYITIQDKDGRDIELRCFVVDPYRSKLTYFIEHEGCSVVGYKND